jgi:hypothetical protein
MKRYFWKNIDSYSYIKVYLDFQKHLKALNFLSMQRTVDSIIFKSKCILCRKHYGQITIETPLYNFCSFKNLKYFLPLPVGLLMLNYPSMSQEGKYWRMPLQQSCKGMFQ